MAFSFNLYWSFRSPHCYLVLDQILALVERYDVEANVRPVYPLAIRSPDFFTRVNPGYRRYYRRLLEPIGNMPPAEAEARYYAQIEDLARAA